MKQLSNTDLTDIRYIPGSPSEAKGIYNQLKATFLNGKEYRLFSEPLISGEKYIWTTEYEGDVLNIMQLSEEKQSLVKSKLTLEIQKLLNAAKTFDDQKFIAQLYQCIEIPTLKDVFIVKSGETENVVLTRWGFISDKPGAEKGILDKIINAKRVPMAFKVQYPDETIAAGAEVFFEYEGKKEIFTSDTAGSIVLPSVKVDSYVKTYEKYKEEVLNIKGFTCYENGAYLITVSQKSDMIFKVVLSDQSPKAGENFSLSYDNQKTDNVSDSKGEMILKKIRVGTEVGVLHPKSGKQMNFICEVKKDFYLIVLEGDPKVEDPLHDMKFQVLEPDGSPSANAEITVKFGTETRTLMTDSEGFAVLKNVKPGTKVNVTAKKINPKK
jgi:hypothetical protein